MSGKNISIVIDESAKNYLNILVGRLKNFLLECLVLEKNMKSKGLPVPRWCTSFAWNSSDRVFIAYSSPTQGPKWSHQNQCWKVCIETFFMWPASHIYCITVLWKCVLIVQRRMSSSRSIQGSSGKNGSSTNFTQWQGTTTSTGCNSTWTT